MTELHEQLAAFRASLQGYDSGQLWEAKRIASSIYILCFDGSGRTKSLLGQLKIKDTMGFFSSYYYPSSLQGEWIMVSPPTPLLAITGQGGSTNFVSAFDHNMAGVSWPVAKFPAWWDEKIFHPSSKIDLSRKNLIFYVRSQDGGSHVDGELSNLDYRLLRTIGQQGVTLDVGKVDGGRTPGNIVWPIVRQIGWELDQSLIRVHL